VRLKICRSLGVNYLIEQFVLFFALGLYRWFCRAYLCCGVQKGLKLALHQVHVFVALDLSAVALINHLQSLLCSDLSLQ
jgi:hypothetical protein